VAATCRARGVVPVRVAVPATYPSPREIAETSSHSDDARQRPELSHIHIGAEGGCLNDCARLYHIAPQAF